MITGNCKHGEFDLAEGCKECIEERQQPIEQWGRSQVSGNPPEPLVTMEKAGETFATITESLLGETAPKTALVLRPGEDVEVRGYYKEAERILEYAKARVIASVEDNKAASDDLTIIARIKKSMLEKRKEYLDPVLDQAEAIRNTYTYFMMPILGAEKLTKDKMLAYSDDQCLIRAKQEEINRKRTEADEAEMKLKGELTESVNLVEVIPEPSKRVSTDMGSSGQRDNWKYEIVDLDALPREYMIPDLVMLNAIAKKYHDNKSIAGVRFYNEPIIVTRVR